jgi:hypothetical protein
MKDPLGQLRLRFADLRLVGDGERVRVYAGKDFSGYEVSVAVLAEPAATDQDLRRAFADAAGRTRTVATAPVQSDVHASIPWLAARLPEGEAVVRRLAAELDPHHPTMPAGSVTLAPMPVDVPPPPVRPDPTLAPMPPPVDMRPATVPAPPAPPTTRPVAPAPRPVGPPHQRPRSPASPTKPSMSPATIITVVVVGLVVLALCCSSGLADLLG